MTTAPRQPTHPTPVSLVSRGVLGLSDAALVGAAVFVASLASGAVLAVVNWMLFTGMRAEMAQAAAVRTSTPPTWVDPNSPTNTWATDAAAVWQTDPPASDN